jgi:hypothetical protein
MVEPSASPREMALQLEPGDNFQWVGEGWGDDGPRYPSRATVQDIYRSTDHNEEDALAIDAVGVQDAEFTLYVYDNREEVVLYGSAKKAERLLDVRRSQTN